MNLSAIVSGLLTLTLWLSIPALLLLVSHRLLHRHLGPVLTYRCWLLLPMTLAAVLLGQWQPQVAERSLALLPSVGTEAVKSSLAWMPLQRATEWPWLLLIWVAGAALCMLVLGLQQWRFLRRTQRAEHRFDNVFISAHADIGPALVGLLQPRIVLPSDFERRYDRTQQAMILRHESLHLMRGDLWVNALLAAWLVLNWFNPIAHLAVARLRRDQELACDAEVMREFPGSAKSYAEAMLSTQLTVLGLPVGCHWQSSHPIKERLIMLNQKPNSRRQRLLALGLFGLAAAALTGIALAGQSADDTAEFDTPASYQSLTPPKYPASAKDEKVAGRVTLKLEIGADGKVGQALVVDSPDARLSESALAAVKNWVLAPAQKDGLPVASWVLVPIDFSLDETAPAQSGTTAPNQLDALYVRTP